MLGRITKVFLIGMAASLLLTAFVAAQSPTTISYQGRLTDAAGQAITTATSVTFAIYALPSGGTALFTSTQNITPDENGVFTVELGPFAGTVFDGSKRYLGIKAGADAEMTPRQLLTGAPYAFNANDIADNSISGSNVINSSLTRSDIADEPGLSYAQTGDGNTLVLLTTTGKALTSVTINAPTSGYVLLTGTLLAFITHTNGTLDNVIFKLSKTSGDVDTPDFATALIRIPNEWPSSSQYYCQLVNLTHMFPVSSGNTTFYLNGYETFNTGNNRILAPRIMAVFVPSSYGTAPPPMSAPSTPTNGPDVSIPPITSSGE